MKEQDIAPKLILRLIQQTSWPRRAHICLPVPFTVREAQNLAAKICDLWWEQKGNRIRGGGRLKITGRLITGRGTVRTLDRSADVAFDVLNQAGLASGLCRLRAQIVAVDHTVYCTAGRKVTVMVSVGYDLHLTAYAPRPAPEKVSAYVPEVLFDQTRIFWRDFYLPLDRPGHRIVETLVSDQEIDLSCASATVVHGLSTEDILYLSPEGDLQQLHHISRWSHLWPSSDQAPAGRSRATVTSQVTAASLQDEGHTLALHVRQQIRILTTCCRPLNLLIGGPKQDDASSVQVLLPAVADLAQITQELSFSLSTPVQPMSASEPIMALAGLKGRAYLGYVAIAGQVQVSCCYMDISGQERYVQDEFSFSTVMAAPDSRAGHEVRLEQEVGSLQASVQADGDIVVEGICSVRAYVLAREPVRLLTADPKITKSRGLVRIEAERRIDCCQREILLSGQVWLSGEELELTDHSIDFQIQQSTQQGDRVLSRGDAVVSLYHLTLGGRQCCRQIILPWRTIFGPLPLTTDDRFELSAETVLLGAEKDSAGDRVLVEMCAVLTLYIYRPAVLQAIAVDEKPADAESPATVQGVFCRQMEIEVIVCPRPRPLKNGQGQVRLTALGFVAEEGRVAVKGDMVIMVDYGSYGGLLHRWTELRPFQLFAEHAAARPGSPVKGHVQVAEVFSREARADFLPWPLTPRERNLRLAVVLNVDLVIL